MLTATDPSPAALALVAADQREAADSDTYTDAELIDYARATIALEDVHGDDALAAAYREVLAA